MIAGARRVNASPSRSPSRSRGRIDVERGEEKKFDAIEQIMMAEEVKRMKASSSSANDNNNSGARNNTGRQHGQGGADGDGDGDGNGDDDNGAQSRIQRLPDMTGKIITVSTEETLKLTKERKKSKRRGGEDSCSTIAAATATATAVAASTANNATQEEIIVKSAEQKTFEQTDSDREVMADVEREFQEFINKLSSVGNNRDHPDENNDLGERNNININRPQHANHAIEEEGSQTKEEGSVGMRRTKSSAGFMSEYTIDTIIDDIDRQAHQAEQRRKSEYSNCADDTLESWSKTETSRTSKTETDEGGGKQRKYSETAPETATISESGHGSSSSCLDYTAGLYGGKDRSYTNDSSIGARAAPLNTATNDFTVGLYSGKDRIYTNDSSIGAGPGPGATTNNNNNHPPNRATNPSRTRKASSHHRKYQSHLRSSLRKSSDGDNNDKSATAGSRPEGISWASLIKVDEEKRKKKVLSSASGTTSPQRARRADDRQHRATGERSTSHLTGSYRSYLSNASPDSKVCSRSIISKSSYHSKGSNDGSKKSNKSGNTVSWKDESAMTMITTAAKKVAGQPSLSSFSSAANATGNSSNNNKDPEHVHKQAKERFDRGIHYAERGKYSVAKERFMSALRYRVMQYGPNHTDVAAAHEMLGHTHYFLSLEKEEDNNDNDLLTASLIRLDEGDGAGSDSMTGWDLTILEQKQSSNHQKSGNGSNGGNKNGKRSGGGTLYLEKAAMHYQTVLDILGENSSQSMEDTKRSAGDGSLTAPPQEEEEDAASFRWTDIADSYKILKSNSKSNSSDDSDDEEDVEILGLGTTKAMIEIIAVRVKEKLDLLPVATMGAGKSLSYAKTFLDS